MKVVILAGGLGTRISEESHLKPKPMIEIGGKPILWHIMKGYGAQGFNEFVICCGYKGYVIKEYFANYFLHMSDITFAIAENRMEVHQRKAEPWQVTLVDTGEHTQTGGRLKRVANHLGDRFCMTYGDGVGDVDLKGLIDYHDQQGRMATLTGVQLAGRYGSLQIEGGMVRSFLEKPQGDGKWVSGGFFVMEKALLSKIENDQVSLENDILADIANEGQLSVWKHDGFWSAMDTMRDKHRLEELWASEKAPWKIW